MGINRPPAFSRRALSLSFATIAGVLLLATAKADAQVTGLGEGLGDAPIDISSSGGTTFKDGIATAIGSVCIYSADASIYADRAEYNIDTKDILLEGNVRIYRDSGLFVGDRAVYNVDSKQVRASSFRAKFADFNIIADRAFTLGPRAMQVEDAQVTTHDSSKPDYHFSARKVRIYSEESLVMDDVTVYIGQTPVFWVPYIYQPLKEATTYGFTPGFTDLWGAFLLTQFGFPVNDQLNLRAHVDLLSRRGVGLGLDANYKIGSNPLNEGDTSFYFIEDQEPNLNNTGFPRTPISNDRYRYKSENLIFLNDDFYGQFRTNKQSDPYVLQDFFQREFIYDPQPETYANLTQKGNIYAISLIGRTQINDFQETTERLPELSIDIKKHPIFGSKVFYESDTTAGYLVRDFQDGSIFADSHAIRFDTFHDISYPGVYFGWLSVTPRAGFRLTYYSDTESATLPQTSLGEEWKPVVDAGIEASFKLTRVYNEVDSRLLGLDSLRHIIQPYTNFSHVSNFGPSPIGRIQYDRLLPSTQLDPIVFPQFTAVDAIDDWDIVKIGVRNRLQTKRDQKTFSWLELDSYFQVNAVNPYTPSELSNFFNVLRFNPVPWGGFTFSSQFPLTSDGFTEVNTEFRAMVSRDVELSVGQRYLNNNPFFQNSNLIRVGGNVRVNDNWSVSAYEQFEAEDGILESQTYSLHRDLTSWVATLGGVIRDNRGGQQDYGVLLTFTLKDLPQVTLPVSFNPGSPNGN